MEIRQLPSYASQIPNNMVDEINDWVSFVQTLDYIGGHFYLSCSAGQQWNHDKVYCQTRWQILKSMMDVVDMIDTCDD